MENILTVVILSELNLSDMISKFRTGTMSVITESDHILYVILFEHVYDGGYISSPSGSLVNTCGLFYDSVRS